MVLDRTMFGIEKLKTPYIWHAPGRRLRTRMAFEISHLAMFHFF